MILSFIDISKLYFIKKDVITKYFSVILWVLAVLVLIFSFMIYLELLSVHLLLSFGIGTIVVSLVCVCLALWDYDLLIVACISSIYVISNMILLGGNLSMLIYIIFNYFFNIALPFFCL